MAVAATAGAAIAVAVTATVAAAAEEMPGTAITAAENANVQGKQ